VADAQVAEDFFGHSRIINDSDDAHRVLANGAAERVHVGMQKAEYRMKNCGREADFWFLLSKFLLLTMRPPNHPEATLRPPSGYMVANR
jgi:hypothetical protein